MPRATQQIEQGLAEVGKRASAPGDAYAAVAEVVERSIDQNFAAGGRPKWESRKDKKPHRLLDKTGRMRRSVGSRVSHSGASIEADASYAPFHDGGTSLLPQREFVMMQPQDFDAAADIFVGFVGEPLL